MKVNCDDHSSLLSLVIYQVYKMFLNILENTER